MHFFQLIASILVLSCICAAFRTLDKEKNNESFEQSHLLPVVKIDTEKTDEPDDRIGLTLNRGHAFAYGPQGFSGSDSNAFGIHAGIRHPGNFYTPLFSQTGGRGSSYSSGPGAPSTWANGNSQLGNGYTGGNSGAGFSGGQGVANADSFVHEFEIPIDNYGSILYHNLKDKKHQVKNANPSS